MLHFRLGKKKKKEKIVSKAVNNFMDEFISTFFQILK